MTTDARPPIRISRTKRCFSGTWSYDTWGASGRPVLFLHSMLFDRTMWWPVAAELSPHCMPIAVDLPGHGDSPARADYEPKQLIDELALLVFGHRFGPSPVIVGHGTSAGLANLFAQRFSTRAVVLADPLQSVPSRPASTHPHNAESLLAEMTSADVPSYFQDLVVPRNDQALLDAYRTCAECDPWGGDAWDIPTAFRNRRTARLAIYSRMPPADVRHVARTTNGPWLYSVYGVPARFPHLCDAGRFASDIRSLL